MRYLLVFVAAVLILVPVAASAQQTAVVTATAPIYVNPKVMPTPLRVAAVGTRLRVLAEAFGGFAHGETAHRSED